MNRITEQREILLQLVAYLQDKPIEDVKNEYLGKGDGVINNKLFSGIETTIARLTPVLGEQSI